MKKQKDILIIGCDPAVSGSEQVAIFLKKITAEGVFVIPIDIITLIIFCLVGE